MNGLTKLVRTLIKFCFFRSYVPAINLTNIAGGIRRFIDKYQWTDLIFYLSFV